MCPLPLPFSLDKVCVDSTPDQQLTPPSLSILSGSSLTIDPRQFYVQLYGALLQLDACESSAHTFWPQACAPSEGLVRAVGRDLEVGQPKTILLARRSLEV